jgi:hypothetical protein
VLALAERAEAESMKRATVAEFVKIAGKPLRLHSLTVIEPCRLHDGTPGLDRSIYDVDLSKKWGYLYDMSGSGGSGPVRVNGIYHVRGNVEVEEHPTTLVDRKDEPPWQSPETLAIRALNRTRRLRALPKAFGGCGDLLEWLERNGINQDSVWCSECNDSMPADELCDHCWWCDKICWYSTPNERCGCASRSECEA